jgi:arylsulfatase A-like enzyme
MMCGLYPDQTLIKQNAIRVRERLTDVQTLAQLFRRNGYVSARVGKIYHYGVPGAIGTDGHDDPDSWEKTVNPRGRDKDEEDQIFSLQPGTFGGTLSWMAADGDDAEQTDGIGARAAVDLLEEFAAGEKPFFLAVGFYRPHTPYVAPKRYFDLYPRDQIPVPTVPENYYETLPSPARDTLLRKKVQVNLPLETARQAIQAYHAAITFMDAQLGLVLDALDQFDLAKNTVVVFTSDHGYHMGEHGYYQKTTLFENAARVPLIIAVPGSENAGQSTTALAEMVDFYPTLAELTGLEGPSYLAGVSLAPVLKNVAAQPRDSALTQFGSGYSLRTPDFRYTEWGRDGNRGRELYDRRVDPEELRNLANEGGYSQQLEDLSVKLRARIATAQQRPEGITQTPAK